MNVTPSSVSNNDPKTSQDSHSHVSLALDQSQLIQITQLMNELQQQGGHHSNDSSQHQILISPNSLMKLDQNQQTNGCNEGYQVIDQSQMAQSSNQVQTIMLNGQPALFIPASAPISSNLLSQMLQMNSQASNNSNNNISSSLDFSSLMSTGNLIVNHRTETLEAGEVVSTKMEPMEHHQKVVQNEQQTTGSQFFNLTNTMQSNQQQVAEQQQYSSANIMYQIPNGMLTSAADLNAVNQQQAMLIDINNQNNQFMHHQQQPQQQQIIYLQPDGTLSFQQPIVQQSQQNVNLAHQQPVNTKPNVTPPMQQQQTVSNDQGSLLISGKRILRSVPKTIASALSNSSNNLRNVKIKVGKKAAAAKTFDSNVDFKQNKLSTLISNNENSQARFQHQHQRQQQQQQQQILIQQQPITIIPAVNSAQPMQFQIISDMSQQQPQQQWIIMNNQPQVCIQHQPPQILIENLTNIETASTERSMVDDDDDDDDQIKITKFDECVSAAESSSDNEGDHEDLDASHPSKMKRKPCDCVNCVQFRSNRQRFEPVSNKKRTHKCHKCPKEYNKTSHLRAHLRAHDNLRPYVCDFVSCKKSFTRSDELKRHKRIHSDDRNFACPVCKKKFLRSDHLSKHIMTHNKARHMIESVNAGDSVTVAETSSNLEAANEAELIAEAVAAKKAEANRRVPMKLLSTLISERDQEMQQRHQVVGSNETGKRTPVKLLSTLINERDQEMLMQQVSNDATCDYAYIHITK